MGFVREVVSQEDFNKYKLGRYEERLPFSFIPNSTYWVIDRERDIYLTSYQSGGNDPEPDAIWKNKFIFYINGDMYKITMTLSVEKLGEQHWSYLWKYQSLAFIPYFSTGIKSKYKDEQFIPIFKETVTLYRHAGEDDPEVLDISFNF